jgi:hypothetical protein
MKLQLVKYRCANCGGEFKDPVIGFYSYGEFLLRSSGGDTVYLDAIGDQAYQEVDGLMKASAKVLGKTSNELVCILRRIYGAVACDPDRMGDFFEIGKFPQCPFCNRQEMEYWEATEPPEFVEKNIPPVTHVGWNILSHVEKQARVEQVLSRAI